MRKIYLIVSGALLGLLPASSQTFERHPGLDAEVIFHQDFEVEEGLNEQQAYDRWAKTPIDTIRELEYYAKIGTSSVSSRTDIYGGSPDWEIFAVRRDSTSSAHTPVNPGDGIVMFNGVETTSSKSETANNVYANDKWFIFGDQGNDAERTSAFEQYGEDGGKYYFKYSSGDIYAARAAGKISSSHYSNDTRSVKKYRRDLYVRGLNIEDETSYRLTFYLKTKKLNSWNPLFYADVMRGYHHQRSAFSMGYKSGKEYSLSLTADDFDGQDGKWQKFTLMTYYINDHESDAYVMYSGDYSWSDDWRWRPSDAELQALGKTLKEGDSLNYVKQPDKFFIRLSFATDSIEYSLDNLSLTKSWIGGCEYDKDKMRVDFGYQTNLSDLVKAEKEATNIPIVEVPDLDGKYFEVWCLKKGGDPDDPDDWEDMPIRSAEYHDDGYMYMFTDYVPVGNEMLPLEFEDYDQVLVTFHNPIDKPEMTLKYTGSYYPKPLDSAWVAQGKIVPDFYNEIATPNPNVFGGVVSKDALPPVMMKAPYEDGSFGLDADTRELRFKFSREVQVDDALEGSLKAIAYVGTEVWKPTWDSENSQLVITRPEGKTTPLKGDYKIELVQILDKSGGQGDDVVLNYHFGDFTTTPSEAVEYTHSDWRSTLTNPSNNKGCLPLGTWTHCYYNSAEQFAMGDGEEAAGKVRLYVMDYTDLDNCGYYLSSRNTKGNTKAKYSGNIFTIINFTQAGGYSIKFKATGWDKTTESSGVETHLYLYPKPSGNADEFTFDSFTNSTVAATKTDLGSIDATTYLSSSQVKDVSTGKWPADVQTFEYTFNIATPGDYVFEWCIFNGSSSGLLIGNYTIGTLGSSDLSTPYVKKLNNAIAAAQDKLNSVVEDKYKGSCYEALGNAITQNQSYKGNYPSKYDSIVAYIGNCVNDQKLRMDTVDLFYTTHESAVAKLAQFKDDMAKYINLSVSQALSAHITANADYVCQTKTTADLTAQINAYKDEIKAVDERMALNEKLIAKINEVNALANAANRRQDYPEYATLVSGLETAQAFDDVNSSDKAVLDAIDALANSQRGYLFKIDYYLAKTRQMKELFALADKLGYDFAEFEGGKDGVATLVNTLQDDDAQLTKALREASILQILKKYKENKPSDMAQLDSLDVSALMNNYFLYNEADTIVDMEKSSSGVWRIKKDIANTTAIPGWTITPTSGSWYPIKTKVGEGDPLNWSVDGHVFYGSLRCDTQSKATLVNVVEGLPEGYYIVGVNGYNNTSDLYYDFKTDSVHYNDRLKELNGGNKWTYYAEVSMDSVLVVGDLVYTLDQQSSSSGVFDLKNAVLRLHGRYDLCDYDAAITAQEAKLAQIITVVDAPAQETEGVQYFNLSGVQINNPKSGEIIIRRTVRNGKVVVDKVLIK